MASSSSYHFNCSTPPEGVHFVNSPPVRGTIDIVWGCLGVILLCTYQAKDVSNLVTYQEAVHDAISVIDRLNAGLWSALQFVIAILCPEIYTAVAVRNWVTARTTYRHGLPYAMKDGVDWNFQKAYHAIRGGFAIKFDKARYAARTAADRHSRDDLSSSALGNDHDQDSGRLLHDAKADTAESELSEFHQLTGRTLLYFYEIRVLGSMPDMTIKDLSDRNKSNTLVQTVAFIQTMWIILQVIVRARYGLFLTQLEVVTLAYAILGLFMRFFDWNRPKDVHTVHTSYATRPLLRDEISHAKVLLSAEAPSDNYGFYSFTFIGIVFGSLHCIAWNEQFPTFVEKTLWHVTSVTITTVPFLFGLADCFENHLDDRATKLFAWCITVLYAISRSYILAETVRALFYLPTKRIRGDMDYEFSSFWLEATEQYNSGDYLKRAIMCASKV